jgi:type II secretory pathway pseudopilin PulG
MEPGSQARRQRGFTYMGVLFLMVLVGLGLAGTGEAWSLASRRAREKQLLWVGNQYARAIRSYYNDTPGAKQYPSKLEDLVEDSRFPEPRHHLRRLFLDPITRDGFDVVLSPDGRIGGVRSRSDDTPMKQAEFPARFDSFKGSTHYSDWHFLADDPINRQQQAQGTSSGTAVAPASFRNRPAPAR